jgi:hypothetical protein
MARFDELMKPFQKAFPQRALVTLIHGIYDEYHFAPFREGQPRASD